MTDLRERFRSLTDVRPPDLWSDIIRREPQPSRGGIPLRRPLVAAVAFTVAAAGVAFAAFTFRDHADTARPVDQTATPPSPPPSAPEQIAYVVGEGADAEIRLVNLDGTGDRLLVSGRDPAWSPDGTRIAFRTGNPERPGGLTTRIIVLDVESGAIQVIAAAPELLGEASGEAGPAVWSPDGSLIAFDTLGGIYVVGPDGSGLRLVSRYEGDQACYDLQPSWSPDGARLAFAVLCDGGNEGLWTVNADGTGRSPLLEAGPESAYQSPAWSPHGDRIAFVGREFRVEGDTYTPLEAGIYVMNIDGSGVTRLTDGADGRPAWSPDGSQIVYSNFADGRIYVMNPDGSEARLIPGIEGWACCVAFRPIPIAEDESPPPESQDPAPESVGGIPGALYPATYVEGDRSVMPLTFVDGSSAELVFREGLEPHRLGAYAETVDGFLVLTAIPPLQISAPELWLQAPGARPFISLTLSPCDPDAPPSDEEIRTMEDGPKGELLSDRIAVVCRLM